MKKFLAFIPFLVTLLFTQSVFSYRDGDPGDAKRERVRSLILMRLTDELNLNDAQAKQLGAIMEKYHQQRRQLKQEIQALTPQLRAASETGKDTEINQLIKNVSSKKDQIDEIDNRMFTEVQRMLTPRQQAKYLVIMEEIRKQIWETKQR